MAGRLAGGAGLVGGMVAGGSQALLDLDADRDGFAELVPAGELRELTPAERVEAELEILGIDLSLARGELLRGPARPAGRGALR